MVNVNRNELSSRNLARLIRQFDTTFQKLKNNNISIFFDELLGKEERLTLAKRLIAIILLTEGYSAYKTSRLLKLSPTTTGIIADRIENGEYQNILQILKKRKYTYDQLIATIDSILHLGGILPSRAGLDRYRTPHERIRRHRSAIAKARRS